MPDAHSYAQLLLFGAVGFILGPILAALFVTVWEMFGVAFRGSLADPAAIVGPAPTGVRPTFVVNGTDALNGEAKPSPRPLFSAISGAVASGR